MRLNLPHDATHPDQEYSMPDPDALLSAYVRAYRNHHYGEPCAPDDIDRVIMLAAGYLQLTYYAQSQTASIGKLRDIWRARAARAGEGVE
jgi:hypothetical protein